MSMPVKGRHTGRAHRTPTVRRARTTQRPHGFPHALRRPLASVAAIVAVAGASAAVQASEAKAHTSAASFTANPVVMAQAAEFADNRNDTNTALAEARRFGVLRASALTQAQTAAAAALAHARGVAAGLVARAHVRRGLLARAQSDPQDVARLLAADRGWGAQQFDCLNSLWAKESGWRWDANNSGSGAYGIPQSLPGSKMASSGGDWATNPITQITWGLAYVSSSYGTPCSAWAHSQAMNWY
jgi:hypothetical protein